MIKDLQYFIEKEDEFIKNHPNYGEPFFDPEIGELSIFGMNDCLDYLSDRLISKTSATMKGPLENEIKFGLSDAQRVLLHLFYGRDSRIFRDDYYHDGITDFVRNLFDTFDDVVRKAPVNSDPILYRFCNDYDRCDMKAGEIIEFPHNLTCTNYDWEQEDFKNVYIITPLKNGNTRAHNLYEICKHGNENQVDFLRHTKFKVTKIENTIGTEYKKFYLEEMNEPTSEISITSQANLTAKP